MSQIMLSKKSKIAKYFKFAYPNEYLPNNEDEFFSKVTTSLVLFPLVIIGAVYHKVYNKIFHISIQRNNYEIGFRFLLYSFIYYKLLMWFTGFIILMPTSLSAGFSALIMIFIFAKIITNLDTIKKIFRNSEQEIIWTE